MCTPYTCRQTADFKLTTIAPGGAEIQRSHSGNFEHLAPSTTKQEIHMEAAYWEYGHSFLQTQANRYTFCHWHPKARREKAQNSGGQEHISTTILTINR